MREFLIIDGYNVINGWPELKALAQENLEHARMKLIDIVTNYRGIVGLSVIVVFDAYMVKGRGERCEAVNGVQIVYSKENETADAVIERYTHLLRDEKVYVVTSDWEEQRVIFGNGAYRVSVRQLREDIMQTEKLIRDKAQKTGMSRGMLEHRLSEEVRKAMELWRRSK
ncbi:MAG TPA: NYN domain-containing protein [Desulfobacteria bacterium]|nr:NYN domain-containing protein [Desulfobacteria bacterium]